VPGIHVLQACGGKDRGCPGTSPAMTTIMK